MTRDVQGLTITSCMAPAADETARAIAAYLGRRLDVRVEFVNDISWEERERRFDQGHIDICWLCGLPYVWKADSEEDNVALLAAPVMQGERYDGRPVYFSDVVVRQDSPFHHFDDLRGATWAYNEPRSHSGYYLTRYRLAQMGHDQSFFGQVVAAGSHQRALQMILLGQIDGAAIDSTVLEMVLQQQPEVGKSIRVIDCWGPSPMPPWLAGRRMPLALRQRVRDELLQMNNDDEGRSILRKGLLLRFAAVTDEDYDAIRQMAQKASTVSLVATEKIERPVTGARMNAPGAVA